ncbi:MAG: hypothetical protein AAF098_12170 [Pseudomonadota bacterium]
MAIAEKQGLFRLPVAPDLTRIRISTLASAASDAAAHWVRNDVITQATLAAAGEIGESIQSGIDAGANDVRAFRRGTRSIQSRRRPLSELAAPG